MINDYLTDIQKFILPTYPSTFVDGWEIDPNDSSGGITNEIMLQRMGGQNQNTSPNIKESFNLYVRDTFGDALAKSKEIQLLLHRKKGKLVTEPEAVVFQSIFSTGPPTYWGKAPNNKHIYLTQYTVFYIDKDKIQPIITP
jgi:hypothetical protein